MGNLVLNTPAAPGSPGAQASWTDIDTLLSVLSLQIAYDNGNTIDVDAGTLLFGAVLGVASPLTVQIDSSNVLVVSSLGAVTVTTSPGADSLPGAGFVVIGGAGGATLGAGGACALAAGSATAGDSLGGNAVLAAGDAFGAADGGSTTLLGGDGGAGATGNGGAIDVIAGASTATDGDGGDVTLTAGAATGSGTAGGVFIPVIKAGATQGAAGAAASELWKTASHATLPDNVVLIGV